MSVKTSGASALNTVRVIGFGRRLAAMLIDAVILVFFTFIVAFLIGFIFVIFNMFTQNDGDIVAPIIVLTGILLSLFYWVATWSRNGQSIGQSTLGITVVDGRGEKLSTAKALVRYIGFLVGGALFGLGFLWIAFDSKRQGLHDKMAGSYVVPMDQDFPLDGRVQFVASDKDKGWIWALLWVIIAVVTPIGSVALYLTVGPVVARFIMNLVGG